MTNVKIKSRKMCVWFTKETRRVPLLQEKLFTFPEHFNSPAFLWVLLAHSLVYCVILWGSLIVFVLFLVIIILFVLQTFFIPEMRKVVHYRLMFGYLPTSHTLRGSLVFCAVFCRSLCVPLSVFLRLLTIHLISSNSSSFNFIIFCRV